MGSEHSTEVSTSTTTTTNNIAYTTTNNYTTNNHTTNHTYHIPVTISQQFSYTVPTTLEPDVPQRSALTYSLFETQDYSNDYDFERATYVTSNDAKKSSATDKKQYLRSAMMHCNQRPVRSEDVRRTFETNSWTFKQDDFNDVYSYLLTIENRQQRLDTIKIVRGCLEENIKFKLDNAHTDVGIFCHFQEVMDDLFSTTTTEAEDRQQFSKKRSDDTEKRRENFHGISQPDHVSLKHSDATGILSYYDADEQWALFNSLH